MTFMGHSTCGLCPYKAQAKDSIKCTCLDLHGSEEKMRPHQRPKKVLSHEHGPVFLNFMCVSQMKNIL